MAVYTMTNEQAVRLATALLTATLTGGEEVQVEVGYEAGMFGVGDGRFAITAAAEYHSVGQEN